MQKTGHRGVVGLNRLALESAAFRSLRKAQRLTKLRRRYPRQLLVGNARLRVVAQGKLTIKQLTQQRSGLFRTIDLQEEIRGRVAHLIVARIDIENGQILFQGRVNFALLKILLSFFQPLGDVRHLDRDPLRL